MDFRIPQDVKDLLVRMDDGDIRKLLTVMGKFRIVPISVTKRVLEEYYELVSESEEYIFSDNVTSKDTVVEWFSYWEALRKDGVTDNAEEMVADNGSLIEESNIANSRTFCQS